MPYMLQSYAGRNEQVHLSILWMICGWACAALCTPRWSWSRFNVPLLLVCGAIVGPFGVFWIIRQGIGIFDKSNEDTARRKLSTAAADRGSPSHRSVRKVA
jgi:hypothetical protein